MPKFYFTYGSNHFAQTPQGSVPLSAGYTVIEADDYNEARDLMNEARQGIFCTQYTEEQWPSVVEAYESSEYYRFTQKKLIEVPLDLVRLNGNAGAGAGNPDVY